MRKYAPHTDYEEDRPREYDAWELEYTYRHKGRTLKALGWKLVENNPVRAVVELR